MLVTTGHIKAARPRWPLGARDLATVRAGGRPISAPIILPKGFRTPPPAAPLFSFSDPNWVPFQEVRYIRCKSRSGFWAFPLNVFIVIFSVFSLVAGQGPTFDGFESRGPAIRIRIWTTRGQYSLTIPRRKGDGFTRGRVAQLRQELRQRSGLR